MKIFLSKTYLTVILGLICTVSVAQPFIDDEDMDTTAIQQDDKLKVVYFTASWCGPCKIMSPELKVVSKTEKDKLDIYKMDIDNVITDDILDVSSVPTMVFFKNGEMLGSHTGAIKRKQIKLLVDQHDQMQLTGNKVNYKPVPSKLTPVAGINERLTVKNIKSSWHSPQTLLDAGYSIYQKLDDKQDLKAALIMVSRSIEISPSAASFYVQSCLLEKLGRTTQAQRSLTTAEQLVEDKKLAKMIKKKKKELNG
jgi:thioredoxin 1